MKRKLIIITSIAAALVFAGCVPGGGRSAGTSKSMPGENTTAVVEKSFNIKTTTAQRQDISDRLTLSGDVEAASSVDVYPNTTGQLSQLIVETGTWVKKNQVLAKIDPSRPGMNYAESPVEAPISGTVTQINSDPGATVSPQMPLLTIGDISRLVITTQIPERFIYMVENGQTAWITSTAYPGVKYRAKVSSISPVVNPASRTLKIKLSLSEKAPLKAGMFVGIDLITTTSRDSLTIPEKALLSRDDQSYVYRINNGHAEKVSVTSGIKNNGLVEITSGLSENDILAIEGVTLLSDGSKINIIGSEGNR
ncbi:MAG: efflux RND transporter periplasmic adaptor subunit [Spirochaetales bacterium]|nr:efflux RND transporter periplasmic adaptor subunit [Spirochaetales bacterium]